MSASSFVRYWLSASATLLLLIALTGCAHSGSRKVTPSLQEQLAGLAPSVSDEEAKRAAACACESSQELARAYGVVGPPLFHNFMVNLGVKERGLCYHWAEDLAARLQALKLTTLELHWGIARAGTVREHNCVVVTAKGQPFQEGVVLDAWRRSGRLHWTTVRADRYPWEKAALDFPR